VKTQAPTVRSVRRISGAPTAPLPSWARAVSAPPASGSPALRPSGSPSLPPPADGRSPLLRRVHSYRRAGLLVGLLAFLRRRAACRGCDRARRFPSHPGLYGCAACARCLGSPERILQVSTTCPRKLWPV
jgi:hypothetical protein